MYQIFSAVEHMHTHHVVHRDLKVIDTSMQCKYTSQFTGVCRPVYWSMQASLLEYAGQFTGVCKPVYWSMQASLLEYASQWLQILVFLHTPVYLFRIESTMLKFTCPKEPSWKMTGVFVLSLSAREHSIG